MTTIVTSGLVLAGFATLFKKKERSGSELEHTLKQNDLDANIQAMKDRQYLNGLL